MLDIIQSARCCKTLVLNKNAIGAAWNFHCDHPNKEKERKTDHMLNWYPPKNKERMIDHITLKSFRTWVCSRKKSRISHNGPSITDSLPCDVLVDIVRSYLNPRDRQSFSATSKSHRRLFPTPLRIQIASNEAKVAFKQKFYVSPQKQAEKILSTNDALVFGEDYVFWTYDFSREDKSYLSLGVVSNRNTESSGTKIPLALRSKAATLSFRVTGGEAGNSVPLGKDVRLEVSSNASNELPNFPSNVRLCLSAQAASAEAPFVWSVKAKDCGKGETVQLHRCPNYVSTRVSTKLRHYAVPDIVLEPFAIYSPRSLKEGNCVCKVADDNLNFIVWVNNGHIHVQALGMRAQLSIAVPILKNDNVLDIQDTVELLQLLKRKKSGRWAVLLSYFAAILDDHDDKPASPDVLFRTLTGYHEKYSFHYDESQNNIYLNVEGMVVESNARQAKEIRRSLATGCFAQ